MAVRKGQKAAFRGPRRMVAARRTVPVDASPLKKKAARDDVEDPPVMGDGQPRRAVKRYARRTVPVDASPLKKETARDPPVKGDGAARRAVKKCARRTFPVEGSPLKKARRQDAAKFEEEVCGNVAEQGAAEGSPPCGQEEGGGILLPQSRRSLEEYELLSLIGEGSYGAVFRAKDRKTGEAVALKEVEMDAMALREVSILASLQHHPCVVELKEVFYGEDAVFMAMEYAEFDLRRVIDGMNRSFSQREVKFLMQQLLQGIRHVHGCGVLHRDLKTANVLFTSEGRLKVCDFGLSRRCDGDDVGEQRQYTDWVGTRWYRAPELLLKARAYSAAVDMWSVGCIMAELLGKAPLFQGMDTHDQLRQICGVLGIPDERTWPEFVALCAGMGVVFVGGPTCDRVREKLPAGSLSDAGYDLLMGLLTFDPSRRMTAEQALEHAWFKEFPPPCTTMRVSIIKEFAFI